MALGYCPALLRHINDIANGNAPGQKMHVAGFLAMAFCCQNSTVSPVNDGNQTNGHRKTLTVKYRQRPTASSVSDEDNCEIDRIPGYLEWTLPALGFKKSSWFLSDEEIRKYCDEASNPRRIPGLTPTIMQEHYDLFIEHANILMSEINKDLVGDAATQFGENVTTGSSVGKVINFNRNGDQLVLDNGIIEMMRDIQENEICGEPCMVGGGLWSAVDMMLAKQCCNAAGIDLSQNGLPKFFFDKNTQSIWGQDTAVVFAPGSVKFLGFNKYTGNFASNVQKGDSYYATVAFPADVFGCNADDCLKDLIFDLQIRYISCPTTIDVNNTPTVVNRGWQFILSKEYALWVQPTNAYASGDELQDTNGILKYFATNSTYGGGAGAYPYAI